MTPQTTLEDRRASARDALERCQALVEPALKEAVGTLHPWPRRMAGYALGWCEADGSPAATAGGKGIRPALAVLGAEAAGAPEEAAVAAAVAVELVHTFTLVHDDIMDGDERRRHRDSAWKAFGTGPAVLAGDALFALAAETLARGGGARSGAAVGLLAAALRELVHGQADDLLFEDRPWTGPEAVTLPEYLAMAAGKTGSLLGCALALGPVLAGAHPPVVLALTEAGRLLGTAFQAVDDVLGTWGDPRATGKPVHGDLFRKKKTLPVLAALSASTPDSRELAALLSSPAPLTEATAHRAATLMERTGARTATLTQARTLIAAACDHLTSAPLAPGAADELMGLSEYLLARYV
ncbi:geranylgeranyl diphosphate synthase type I [Streptomyces olivoverticillatus]|uniref:Geranylgeranyl diphosphate synthase type I n=1 Tax=Streptomyces olivoverticillatus TaxID=66427 RepID=A0A7W7PJP8_9ACTN|nr:geranylgeranyl diphosphate synthase type I [Streptomyces olivoverticillatus]